MRKAIIAAAVLLLGVGAYWLTLPRLPPLTGITRIELSGPRGRLREITQSDTISRIVALAERHYPRWRSTLAATHLGPLVLTFYRGDEPIRWVHFGASAIASCDEEVFCVDKLVSTSVVRELVELVHVPRRLVDVPALAPAT